MSEPTGPKPPPTPTTPPPHVKPAEGPLSRRDELSEAQARYEAEVRAGAAPPPSAAIPRHQAVAQAQARKALDAGTPAAGSGRGGGVSLRFSPTVPLANKLWVVTGVWALAALVAFFAVAAHDAIWRDRRWLAISESAPGGSAPDAPAPTLPPDLSFTLMIKSEPSGAEVYIQGQSRGRTPLMANVACAGGEEIGVRVERSGRRPWTTGVPCQRGGTVNLRVELDR